MDYNKFIENKLKNRVHKGINVDKSELSNILFEYQKDIVKFALKKAKVGVFTNTGTGKTLMQLEYAKQIFKKTGYNVLILCPLSVANQTVNEGRKIDLDVNNLRKNNHLDGVNIINYEKLDTVDIQKYNAIVLDEASILKNFAGKTRNRVIEVFRDYDYKACFSATPSPNDFMELANYSEFLDYMSRSEMLSTYFIHDSGETQKWRLKKHAKNDFWKWFSGFSVIMSDPNKFGYNEKNYHLPKLIRHRHPIKTNKCLDGNLFPVAAKTLNERRDAKKQTLEERCQVVAELVNNSNDIWLVWTNYNNESDMLKKLINNSVEISGSSTDDQKEKAALDFSEGRIKCLISKPSIFGFGMNFQVCHNQTFFPDDSFEMFFQAEKRTYRLGQTKDVNTHLIYSDLEGDILKNLERKELQYKEMFNNIMINFQSALGKSNKEKTISENLKIDLPKFI